MDLVEIGWRSVDWMGLAKDKDTAGKLSNGYTTGSVSK
jgi:hypothetical protein